MKSTGVVRKTDPLGRVVLPVELRRTLNINDDDPLEVFTEEDRIILRKYNPGCHICGTVDGELKTFKGKNLCPDCVKGIKAL
jgi:transcriptional pleiotropic regulator of transition state genes